LKTAPFDNHNTTYY